MKTINLCLLLIGLSSLLHADGMRPLQTVAGGMMSETCLTAAHNDFAAFYNPALLPLIPNSGMGLEVYKPYNLPDLTNAALNFMWKRQSGWSGAVLLNQMGNSLYRETQMSLSFGAAVSGSTYLGIRLNAWQFWVKNYDVTYTSSIDAGLYWKLPQRFSFGLVVSNFIRYNSDNIPTGHELTAAMEVGYSFSNSGQFGVQLYEDVYNRLKMRMGTVVPVISGLSFAAGVQPGNDNWGTGFIIKKGNLKLLYSLSEHAELGETHAVGVAWIW